MVGVSPLSNEISLLRYAIRKLNPEIFSHPIWVRFWKKKGDVLPEAIQNLYEQAEQLQSDSPEDSCQVLLICAAYQSSTGRLDNALRVAQQALALAERNHLSKQIMWATWGACAICFQQENFDRAARYLEELETVLTKENEWVLADFVDVIRQSLCQPEMVSAWRQAKFSNGTPSDPFRFTFHWLQKWGNSFQDAEPDGRSKWGHAIDFFHKCGIRLNGDTNGERQLSVWKSIRNLLRLQEYERKIESYAEVKDSPRPAETVPEPIIAKTATEFTSPKKRAAALIDNALGSNSKSVLANDKVNMVHLAGDATTYIPVAVHMLGPFTLMIGERSVKLPMSRGLSLLQYLLLHHRQHTPREVLMDIFWPDAEPETARNNLNVAIHGLRTALRSVMFLPVIIFEDGAYGLAPDLQVWLDAEEFEKYVKSGQQLESRKQLNKAVNEYETAISLYQGDFLADTPYESWTVLDRERLRIAYLDTLAHLSLICFNQERYAACVNLCQLILARDICREDVHCRLMLCYSRLGQAPLALRQYQVCVEALQGELDVKPAPETTELYQCIRRRKYV
jgi:DNA-binding SARP family transcriptional activator